MSFDLDVFFKQSRSPKDILVPILRELGDTGIEDDDGYWFTKIDKSSLHFRIKELIHPDQPGHSLGFKWCLHVYTNSGCTPTARWAQFSVLYRCLAFLPETAAHNPQSGQIFTSPDSYWEFASHCVSQWPGLPRKLKRLGLMSNNGKLALDRPPHKSN